MRTTVIIHIITEPINIILSFVTRASFFFKKKSRNRRKQNLELVSICLHFFLFCCGKAMTSNNAVYCRYSLIHAAWGTKKQGGSQIAKLPRKIPPLFGFGHGRLLIPVLLFVCPFLTLLTPATPDCHLADGARSMTKRQNSGLPFYTMRNCVFFFLDFCCGIFTFVCFL